MAGRPGSSERLCIDCHARPRRSYIRKPTGKRVTDSRCHDCGLARRRAAKGALAPMSKFSWQGLKGRPSRQRKKFYVTPEMLRG